MASPQLNEIKSSYTRPNDSKPGNSEEKEQKSDGDYAPSSSWREWLSSKMSVVCCKCCTQTKVDSQVLCTQTEVDTQVLFTSKKVDTQLYCPNPSDLVRPVIEKLPSLLIEQLNNQGIKLNYQICKTAHELKTDVPLILIILHSTRLGTDVSNAVEGIKTISNVAVLILHHAMRHALPSESSRKILTAPEYNQIGTIVDMGFISDEGIYSCDMNKNALEDLTLFIKNKSINQ